MDSGRFDRFLVVDVETTGLYNSDRVVEVGAVTLSSGGQILDEWDTLVNPGRDVGPTHIHGVTASMVSAAPRFEEVAEALAARVDGAVLVAHNLAFDSRMLTNEYARLGALLDAGRGVCTLAQCGGRLEEACAMHGVELHHHHRALADARATAHLLLAAKCRVGESVPAKLEGLGSGAFPRTLRREAVLSDAKLEMPYLARLAACSHHRAERGAPLIYLDMLDWVLDDLAISPDEWSELLSLASSLGMADADVESAHQRYLHELVVAASRDGRVTDQERALLYKVADALRLDTGVLEQAVRPFMEAAHVLRLQCGMQVCFTGTAVYSDGTEIPRATLARISQSIGLRVVDSVTKKGCDILVAADPSSLSGKASKARQYHIPILDVRDFACADVGVGLPTH
jgi:DNA polymerase III subunit epsilon